MSLWNEKLWTRYMKSIDILYVRPWISLLFDKLEDEGMMLHSVRILKVRVWNYELGTYFVTVNIDQIFDNIIGTKITFKCIIDHI